MTTDDQPTSFQRVLKSTVEVYVADMRAAMEAEILGLSPIFPHIGSRDKFRRGWNVDYSFALFPRFTRLERAIYRRRRKVRWWWRDHVVEAWRVLRDGIDARSDW